MGRNRPSLDWPVWLLLALDLLVSLGTFPHLPARVPIHWNWQGQVNGWGSPFAAAFGPFFIGGGGYLLLLLLPAIDPRRRNYTRFTDTYRFIRLIFVLFVVALHWVTLAGDLGARIPMDQAIMTGVGALLLVMGNVMGRIRPTWFVGIRTPWTLSDEGVWTRTHRLGGRIWVAAGLLGMAGGLLGGGGGRVVFLAAMVAAGVVPVVYSYIDFQKNHG